MLSLLKRTSNIPVSPRNLYKYHSKMNSPHSHAFVFDIDGTLILNKKQLPGSSKVLNFLTRNNFPYVLLTNNVSRSQREKAQELTQLLDLQKPIDQKQIILNYTPIKDKLSSFEDGIVLIVARQIRLKQILPLSFIQKYITVDQFCTLFPQSVPLAPSAQPQHRRKVLQRVEARLGKQSLDKYKMKFSAVLILTTPDRWQQCYQIIIDCLSTPNGYLSKQKVYHSHSHHIPVITCYNDLFHVSHNHNLPRLLMKPFNEGLKCVYKLVYKQDLQIQIYGKPHPNAFEYAQKQIENLYGKVEKMVMVGDNVEADIECPVELGWDTILVKTGVNKHHFQKATINSEHVEDGIKLYFEHQKLSYL